MKKLCCSLFMFLWLFQVKASHIVGGEFQLKHQSGSTFIILRLNLYFDNVFGNPNAFNPSVVAGIFDKQTNLRIFNVNLPYVSRSPVTYNVIACTNSDLSTDKIVYESLVTLHPSQFSSLDGYYVVAELCCRNFSTLNIVAPGNSGQAYYLEFPAVTQNNQPFINSSPELFLPVSDYACINELFNYNFAGTDPDGDSLVYELATPLRGNRGPGNNNGAPPGSLPLPPVNWISGYSETSQIPGSPPLTINTRTGYLTVMPSQAGLYVFGVRCSEYRNKKKIGEVRRDYQLMVIACPQNKKPAIQVSQAGQTTPYQEGQVIQLNSNSNRCLNLFLSDPDADENLFLEVKPVNFTLTDPFTFFRTGMVNRNNIVDTIKTTACIPSCFSSGGQVYQVDFIVSDDGCSLPKKDTVRVSFVVEDIANKPSVLSTTAPDVLLRPKLGETVAFDVLGIDLDGDIMSLTVTGKNFNLSTQPITFKDALGQQQVKSTFSWPIDCKAASQTSYLLEFKLMSGNCGQQSTRTTTIEIIPDAQDTGPEVATTAPSVLLKPKIGETISFDVSGFDADQQLVRLSLTGRNFQLNDLPITFTPVSGQGSAVTRFTWKIDCSAVKQASYLLEFAASSDFCSQTKTANKVIEVQPQYQNDKPLLTSNIAGRNLQVAFGTTFTDTIYATDINQDLLNLQANSSQINLAEMGISFTAVNRPGAAKGVFKWSPTCPALAAEPIIIDFTLTETACQPFLPEKISTTLTAVLPDILPFKPANIFTPNQDGLNDYFTMPALPPDICTSIFKNIEIFNRWGKQVYKSTDRSFKWDGLNVTDGVYFYQVSFTDKQYKGVVTLTR